MELEFSREVWDADALWESYMKSFFLCIFLFFTKCIGGEIREERASYIFGVGGLKKMLMLWKGKRERREFIKRKKRTKGELQKM